MLDILGLSKASGDASTLKAWLNPFKSQAGVHALLSCENQLPPAGSYETICMTSTLQKL
jgi:hypothetical protein